MSYISLINESVFTGTINATNLIISGGVDFTDASPIIGLVDDVTIETITNPITNKTKNIIQIKDSGVTNSKIVSMDSNKLTGNININLSRVNISLPLYLGVNNIVSVGDIDSVRDITPESDNTYQLGNVLYRWAGVHSMDGLFDGSVTTPIIDHSLGVKIAFNGSVAMETVLNGLNILVNTLLSGNLSCSGNIYPLLDNFSTLGINTNRYSTLYTKNIQSSDGFNLKYGTNIKLSVLNNGVTIAGTTTTDNLTVGTLTGYIKGTSGVISSSATIPESDVVNLVSDLTTLQNKTQNFNTSGQLSSTLIPAITNTINLGSTLNKYANIYTTAVNLNGTDLNTILTTDESNITTLQNKTQYQSASLNVTTFTGTISTPNIIISALTGYLYGNGTSSVSASTSIPQANVTNLVSDLTTLQNKTQYQSASANVTTFTGTLTAEWTINTRNIVCDTYSDLTITNTGGKISMNIANTSAGYLDLIQPAASKVKKIVFFEGDSTSNSKFDGIGSNDIIGGVGFYCNRRGQTISFYAGDRNTGVAPPYSGNFLLGRIGYDIGMELYRDLNMNTNVITCQTINYATGINLQYNGSNKLQILNDGTNLLENTYVDTFRPTTESTIKLRLGLNSTSYFNIGQINEPSGTLRNKRKILVFFDNDVNSDTQFVGIGQDPGVSGLCLYTNRRGQAVRFYAGDSGNSGVPYSGTFLCLEVGYDVGLNAYRSLNMNGNTITCPTINNSTGVSLQYNGSTKLATTNTGTQFSASGTNDVNSGSLTNVANINSPASSRIKFNLTDASPASYINIQPSTINKNKIIVMYDNNVNSDSQFVGFGNNPSNAGLGLFVNRQGQSVKFFSGDQSSVGGVPYSGNFFLFEVGYDVGVKTYRDLNMNSKNITNVASIKTNALKVNVTTVTTTPFSILESHGILAVNTTSSKTLTLPLISGLTTANGTVFIIKDISGTASRYPITINTQNPNLLDGKTQWIIRTNYASISVFCDGTNYYIF